MLTLLLCQCDSAVTKLLGNLNPAVLETHEVGTNCNDVKIAGFICGAVVLVALFALCGFIFWKIADNSAKAEERKAQNEKEKEEIIRKQRADLQEKKLQIRHDVCKSEELKKYDLNQIEKYVNAIDEALGIKVEKEETKPQPKN